MAPAGAVYVVGGDYRGKSLNGTVWNSVNLRTQFHKLIRRAGLKPWPRPFNNCRASCETDLTEHGRFPSHVVCEWIGHSPAVAATHYLTVRETDFERAAAGGAESGAFVVQKPVQSRADAGGLERTRPTEVAKPEGFSPLAAGLVSTSPNEQMTLRGFEPRSHP